MDARAIIAKLRMGKHPSPQELAWFADGLASGGVSDAQAGAFAMAVCLNGLGDAGRVALTRAMRDTGKVLRWDLPGPVVDKHSTGGVGDCISLLLAPALAACGAYVPMISGRGLGHTGGTLDKLESIPGFRTGLTEDQLRAQLKTTHCAIVSATAEIAPADRRLYAIRDVTGTVESIDLITASILSKKLAAGLEALVLDVKVGSGAFMKTHAEAEALALGGIAVDADDGAARIEQALESGEAAEWFGRMVTAQGGPADFVDRWPDRLPAAPVMREVPNPHEGYVCRIDGEALGQAVVHLGGGRLKEGDRINLSVGFSDLAGIGEEVSRELPLAMVHAATEADADRAIRAVQAAYVFSETPPVDPPLIHQRIS